MITFADAQETLKHLQQQYNATGVTTITVRSTADGKFITDTTLDALVKAGKVRRCGPNSMNPFAVTTLRYIP